MGFIKGRDTIRGTDGSIVWKINGQEYDFFHITQMEINLEIDQDEVPRIGSRTKGTKMNTISLSGSATGYYGDPALKRAITDYVNGGSYPDMEIILTNEDKDTQAVKQTFVGKGVTVNTLLLAEIDAGTTMLEEDFDFNLESYVIKDEFQETEPEQGSVVSNADVLQPLPE